MDSIQITELDSILNIILKYKSKLISTDESWGTPKVVSFAVKNDTLKGNFIHDTIKLMNTNGINYYFIRRMNEDELKAIERFQHKK